MKSQDKKQLQEKTIAELSKQAAQLRSEIEQMAIERASGRLHNTAMISKKKKELAQVLTSIRSKELAVS